MPVRQKTMKSKSVRAKHGEPKETPNDERIKLLSEIWGKRRLARLNQVIKKEFCGVMTVREFVAIVLDDKNSFPRGLDTWLSIGDFEGNFCTNVLSVTLGGRSNDHVCLCGDPHFDQI